MAPAFEVSWAEVLCGDCAQDILARGWGPRHQPLLWGETSCTGCATNLGRLAREARGEGFQIAHWSLTVPEGAERWRTAQHEAAHAVLGERNGLIVTNAQIASSREMVGGVEKELNGHVHFDFPEGGVPLSNLANGVHAGWAVDRLWLKSLGLEGDLPAQLDAAKGAAADMAAIGTYDPAPDVHVQAMRDTDAQVLEYRDEITAVQEELLRSTRIDGDAVRHAMQRVREADQTRAIAKRTTHQPSPPGEGPAGTAQLPAAVAGGTSTPNTGGTGMSFTEQATATLSAANERAGYIRGALQQASMDIQENAAQIGMVSSEAQTLAEVSAVYRQAMEQLEQVQGLIEHASTVTETYAASLLS
ncbi:hypothetical protein E1181_25630 [Saccharopolyspora terrae]|uniref:Uncharacterized protein n=1 Tax=Saccharopolyspora terrae TaxID=2530384 RepID=A0A4R4V7P5_9PSEU|nr:hypothetical protein [Saccharopolyspora terrae]TDD01288.1 hypothetical protein E1181_25630 [Saccharopolyspora terrae]